MNFRLSMNFKTIDICNEEQDDEDRFCELEEASETADEVQTHVVPANIEKVLCNKFLNLPSPKVSLSRIGVESTCMEQTMLLKKWIFVH